VAKAMSKQTYLLALLLLALTGVTAVAQRPATGAAPKPTPPVSSAPATTPQASSGPLPTSKMGIIYTDLFFDAKGGISKFTTVLTRLNGEFQKPKDELTQMQNRAQQLQEEVTRLQNAPAGTPIDQKSITAKVEQLESLKREIQRKGEDAQASYNKRRGELFAPLQEEVGKALEVFAKARGINIILDGTQVPLIYAADSIDITKAFITDFNSKNPVTASTTPPQ
jgi:Skp family chaperone for outer membrane proteins